MFGKRYAILIRQKTSLSCLYLSDSLVSAKKRESSRFPTRFSVTSIRLILAGSAAGAMLNRFKLPRVTSSSGSNDLLSTAPFPLPFAFHSPASHRLIDLKSNIHPSYYSGSIRELADLKRPSRGKGTKRGDCETKDRQFLSAQH